MDESFWQRARVDKSMAPSVVEEQTWIWACVEVYANGTTGRYVFRICKNKADAIDNKPRGTHELTRFIKCHAWPGNTVASDRGRAKANS